MNHARNALVNLQRFAADRGYTGETAPLPPDRLDRNILAGYYGWLRQKRCRNVSIRLYLIAAGQYLNWLEAEGRLPIHLRTSDMRAALEKKTGRRGRRVRPERRSADDAVGALLPYSEAICIKGGR